MARGLLLLAGGLAAFMLLDCERKQPREQPSNAEIEGQWLYDNNCAECHEAPQPDLHKQPPNLHGLFLRKTLPSGAPGTDAQVRKTIIEGRGTMPAFDRRLQEEDVKDLVKCLRNLK
ncbi:MAG: cytochrome c [Terriglobales bacterium]